MLLIFLGCCIVLFESELKQFQSLCRYTIKIISLIIKTKIVLRRPMIFDAAIINQLYCSSSEDEDQFDSIPPAVVAVRMILTMLMMRQKKLAGQ